jgi:uncharacterized protein (DUF2235 family)
MVLLGYPMRNIVLCCDGTANEYAKDRTNIVKLFSTLVQEPSVQTVSYHPGLGTMEPPGTLSPLRRRLARLLGQAFGYGLPSDIRDAYVFLMNSFESGDRLFMFGFSRGAYTVRAVASLLRMYGLIPRGNEPLVPYAIRMLSAINRKGAQDTKNDYFELAEEFKATFGTLRECKPWFVGVFDTVSSVGWIENPVRLPYTADNPDIEHGRHAVAIDERRAFFRTNLWRRRGNLPASGPRDLKQVWFPGVHSDVGGGYTESESGLSKIALKWMLDEAVAAGLAVDPEKVETILGNRGPPHRKPDPTAGMHESLRGLWWVAEFFFKRHFDWNRKEERRRMNLGRRRTIPPGSLIHPAAYERGPEYRKRLPPDAIRVG